MVHARGPEREEDKAEKATAARAKGVDETVAFEREFAVSKGPESDGGVNRGDQVAVLTKQLQQNLDNATTAATQLFVAGKKRR